VGRLPERRRFRGAVRPGGPDWVELPFEVPPGVGELAVRYRHDRPPTPPGVPGNALDIGIMDGQGMRGWSGGARDRFVLGPAGATPGYLPGPVGAGTWRVLLGPYTVAPQGLAWEVEVTLAAGPGGPAFVPDPAPARAAGRGRAWYRGDLHTHTVHSDGRRTPAELAADARAAGLDFLASTEHNTTSAGLGWGAHAGPDLLVVDGVEVTTRDGHWLALGVAPGGSVEWRYRAADGAIDRVLAGLRGRGGLAVAAHPFCPLPGCAWRFGWPAMDAVEVWNGPWTPDDEAALAAWDRLLAAPAGGGGRFLPAVAGSDAHGPGDRVGHPHTVALADGLDRRSVLAALAAGRCWLAGSAAVELELEAAAGGRVAGIGMRLDAPAGRPVAVALRVEGAAGALARLCTPTGPVLEAPLAGDRETVRWTTTPAATPWVRAEVRLAAGGEVLALTNPVFLGPAGPSGPPRA
jgi:predicted metal-dependent phosphoesterase TrpH